MATNYPGALDVFADVASTTLQSAVVSGRKHHNYVNDFGDALVAIETLLGVTGSTVPGTIIKQITDLTTLVTAQSVELAHIYFTGTNAVGFFAYPFAWYLGASNIRSLQLGYSAIQGGEIAAASHINNLYSDSATSLWKYMGNGLAASSLTQLNGDLIYQTAPVGVADALATLTERFRVKLTGEVGIGVQPSAWTTANVQSVVQTKGGIALAGGVNSAGINEVVSNAYYDVASAYRYIYNQGVSIINFDNGITTFKSAVSGVAGAVATLTNKLVIGNNGTLNAPLLHNATSPGNVASGTYSPVLVAVANNSAPLLYHAGFLRVGNMVTVSMCFRTTTTVISTETIVGIPLPVASDFGDVIYCSGYGGGQGAAGTPFFAAVIVSDPTNNRAEMRYNIATTGNLNWWVTYTYLIM